jgi:hypothetical protein
VIDIHSNAPEYYLPKKLNLHLQTMVPNNIPPFPDNVPTAPLVSISLSKLLAHDAETEERLWTAACQTGFFYLDLRRQAGHSSSSGAGKLVDGEALLQVVDRLFQVGRRLFDTDEEEKRRFDYAAKGSYFG